MGYRISIKELDVDVIIPLKALLQFKEDGMKVEHVNARGKSALRIMANTEQGWVGIWAEFDNPSTCHVYGYGCSRTFYSRNGEYFLSLLKQMVIQYKGNLLLITRGPDTGGGSTTIIYQGEQLHGVFSTKLGSPLGHRSIWKSQYNEEEDVDKPVDITVHDVAAGTTEHITLEPEL